jgi:hypothetical protein
MAAGDTGDVDTTASAAAASDGAGADHPVGEKGKRKTAAARRAAGGVDEPTATLSAASIGKPDADRPKAKPRTKAKVKPVAAEVDTCDTAARASTAGAERPAVAKPKADLKPKAKPKAKPAPRPRALVQRVYNTIDGELTKLEKQKGLTSQDRERASRALSQMVNALEKAVEMQRDITKTKASGGDSRNKEALAHAEDLRREIAERLERLNRKRASGRRSE